MVMNCPGARAGPVGVTVPPARLPTPVIVYCAGVRTVVVGGVTVVSTTLTTAWAAVGMSNV